MANCDAATLITSAVPYTAANLGSTKRQKALAVYALFLVNAATGAPTYGSTIQATVAKLGAVSDDQLQAALTLTLLNFTTRAGASSGTLAQQLANSVVLNALDERTLNRLFVDQLCTTLSSLVP